MPEIKSYRDLIVWQKAMDLVTSVYGMSNAFPKSEEYALRLQLRRAAVSVPANIAEGHGRTGSGEYLHHLSIAHGSLSEVETLLGVAQRLGYLESDVVEAAHAASQEVGRLIRGLMRRLRESAAIGV